MLSSKEFFNNSILTHQGSRISLRYPRFIKDSPLKLKIDNEISINIYKEKLVKSVRYDEKVKVTVKLYQKRLLSPGSLKI